MVTLEEASLDQGLNYTWITGKDWFLRASESTADAPHWKLLEELFSAPWFFRLWVIQEFALARHILFYINGYSFRLLAVAVGYMALQSGILEDMQGSGVVPKNPALAPGNFTALSNVRNLLRRSAVDGRPPSLSTIRYGCWNSNATNPRDFVYGLLGLGFKPSKRPIIPKARHRRLQMLSRSVSSRTRISMSCLSLVSGCRTTEDQERLLGYQTCRSYINLKYTHSKTQSALMLEKRRKI